MNIARKKFTISGTIGVAGVTMQGFPASGTPVTTDENGVYTVQVDYGWSGTVRPIRVGYTFQPPERTYTKVLANATDDYKALVQTFTISGTTTQPGVKLVGFLEDVVSDATGRYTASVVYGWSGPVVPEKTGYRFEPPSISYSPVDKDYKEQNYKAYEVMFTISGTVKTAGVALNVTGLPKPVVSGADGSYRVEVRHGWTGKIKPVKEGVSFTPEEHSYPAVMENQINQDFEARVFTYEITGTTGLPGVIMKGLPDDPITNENGYYAATVTHGWSGKVTPEKPGQKFDPPSKQYTNVKTKYENQDYKASAIYLTISGTAGTNNVTLAGLPGDPSGDATGAFSAKVPYGWSGTVTPMKTGWSFEPPSYEYNSVTQDQVRVIFKAQRITYQIAGNAGQPGVTLSGFPTSVVSGQDGSYSATVDFNWNGTVIPRKEGFTFEPASREYKELQISQANQDYQALIMRHSITGRVVDDAGAPVGEVIVGAEGESLPVLTGPDGKFDLKVPHRWQGRVMLQKDGYTLTPATKSFSSVIAPPPEFTVTAKVRMLTITDRLAITQGAIDEPLAGVRVTANPPGTNSVTTDASGKYSIKVPWGWTGVLVFERPDIVFDPNTKAFTNVTEDIDNINPKPPAPSPQPPSQQSIQQPTPQPGPQPIPQPGPQPVPQPGPQPIQPAGPQPIQPAGPQPIQPAGPQPIQPAGPQPTQPAGPQPGPQQEPALNASAIQQRIEQLNAEQTQLLAKINAYKQQGQQPPVDMTQRFSDIPEEISKLLVQMRTAAPGPQDTPPPAPRADQGPVLDQAPLPGLLTVLADLARQTGVTIAVDMTVKDDPVTVSFSTLIGQPVSVALQRIVSSTKTPYKVEPVNDRLYKVYRPVSNTFVGDELINALQSLSASAGVPIVPDPNVTGTVNISFTDVPLEDALDMMLAGKPYVFKRLPRYYLVADRGIAGRAFPDISETRRIRLNYMQATRAQALLSPVFRQYVQAEVPNPRDPNDQGNTLLVTASATMIDRILEDIRKIDYPRRQVLLDARVVAMERGNLLNLGVEWGWPTIRAGTFHDTAGADGAVPLPGWPWGVQIGYTPDRTFTDSLMMALNLLEENSQADIIANPKVIAQDGRQAEIRVVQEEWFMMTTPNTEQGFFSRAELEKIESGTVMVITPRIGDNNDITLEMAVEVSDSIPKARGSDLPLVTRRMAKNAVTLRDGGTVAVGGLTENRSKSSLKRVPGLANLPLVGELFKNRNNDKASREVAVFVTAHLVPEGAQMASMPAGPAGLPAPVGIAAPAGMAAPAAVPTAGTPASPDDFRRQLAESMQRNR